MPLETMINAVGIIGRGRVGQALALAFHERTAVPIVMWDASSGRVDTVIRDVATMAPSLEDMASACGILLLTVPDDVIGSVATTLAGLDIDWSACTVAHFSGRCGADVLQPLHERGATVIAFHPAMAFAGDVRTDASRIDGVKFAVSALTEEGARAGFAIAAALGAEPFLVRNEDRTLYHAALTHTTNHLVTLVVQAQEILDAIGVPDGSRILGPAMTASLSNALAAGSGAATGPVVRGDAGTVRGHVAALGRIDPGILESYVALTRAGIAIARKADRITDAQAAHVMASLDGHGSID